METGTTDGHRHHVRELSVYDCSRCPECNLLYFTGGDDPPEECVHCEVALEEVRLDCKQGMQRIPLQDETDT